jgi:hypothetical protein
MKRVCVVCEGQTEETFVRDVLAPAFIGLSVHLSPETIETSPGHKGGALRYDRVKRHLRNTLRQRNAPTVTTLFDLYRLDQGFPEHANSKAQTDLGMRLDVLRAALHADIVAEAGCRPERFIPHIQPYEFEALLFSDVQTLSQVEAGWQSALAELSAVRAAAHSPEYINDRPETKPAAHLERALKNPSYHKRRHGPIAAMKIGLSKIESECVFFSGWLMKLRALSTQPL